MHLVENSAENKFIHAVLSVGKFEREMHTINRPGCQALCLQAALRLGAAVHYESTVTSVDVESGIVEYTQDGKQQRAQADTIVGADGAFSLVRQAFMSQRAYCVDRFKMESFSHGWKRVSLSNVVAPRDEPNNSEKGLRPDCMHLWPFPAPGNGIVIACLQANTPGLDAAIVMPFSDTHGPWHFSKLSTRKAVEGFFKAMLPEMVHLDPSVVDQFLTNPVGR
jgi:2-polyprenyl-6-methoxyphenol hydroxylase-like FAD-dependent oxidoreductase